MRPHLAAVTTAALMAAPLIALAQPKSNEQYTYRCVGTDGKKYYGQTIPNACLGQPLELINKQGLVVRRIDPEGDEKKRIAKEAEAEKQREREAATKDAQRRNRALLATYTSEKDIEDSRARDLRNHDKGVQETHKRIEEIKKRQAQFQKELDLFKTSGKGQPPARLKDEITNAEIDLKAQEALLEAKKKEALGINARYDEDRRRYLEVTGKDPSGRASALGMEKGVTVTTKPAPPIDNLRDQHTAQQRAASERAELLRLERERENDRRRQQYDIQRREAERRAQERRNTDTSRDNTQR